MPCLTKDTREKFLDAIRKGVIEPSEMLISSSKERQALLSRIVGPENAGWVNSALESKILLKDQKRGMVSWAKKVSGISEPARRDMLSRIQREKKVFDPVSGWSFLEDLAAKKFGHEITFDEAKNVSKLATQVKNDRALIKESDPDKSISRIKHAESVVDFQDYVNGLKLSAGKLPPSWYLKHPFQSTYRSAGVAKSLLSTLDNSWFGRQGIKMFAVNKRIWFNGFLKSWVDIGKELIGRDAMHAIRVDVLARKNALDGKYAAAKIDLGITSEEAFPSHVLTKIPGAGRVASAAESAFNGAAMRFRADYADKVIRWAEEDGVNTLDPVQAEGYGRVINSMTGRGNIGRLDAYGKEVNALIFSVKFLKSNFDTLTAHHLQRGITPFARKLAAKNLLKIVGHLAGLYTIANLLKPGSAELDPRSSIFGRIQSGNTTFDPTGGMASLATLAARLVPTMHNGEWGFWTKSRDGTYRKLGTGKFGSASPLDVLEDFFEGKFAPYAAWLRDMWKGKDFQGRKTYVEPEKLPEAAKPFSRIIPTPRSVVQEFVPIPAQNFEQTMADPEANVLLNTIMDGLGISVNTYSPPKSETATTAKEIQKMLHPKAKREKSQAERIKALLKGP